MLQMLLKFWSSILSDYMNSGKTYHAGSTAINASAHEMTEDFCKSLDIVLKQVTFSEVGGATLFVPFGVGLFAGSNYPIGRKFS